MNKHDFTIVYGDSGASSGGQYSSGYFLKNNRRLELSYRTGLGLVCYQIDNYSLSHVDYMKLLKVHGKNHYPGFSKDRLQAFEDLLFDLTTFAKDFIIGNGREFIDLAINYENNPNIISLGDRTS